MAETFLASASERQVWMTKYFQEYVRLSRFMPYMSNSDINKGGIILTKFDRREEAMASINVPFIGRLKSAGVTGAQVLDGAEEELANFNCNVSLDWRRNAVRLPKSSTFRTEINLLDAARDALKVWEAEKLRDDIIKAMASVIVPGAALTNGPGNDAAVYFDAATTAQKNTWTANNADRILFGSANSNYSPTFLTATGNVAPTAKVSVANVSLAKRIAKLAGTNVGTQRIRPFRANEGDGTEYFVAFHGARTFRDLKADTTMIAANTQARAREGNGMDKNPIFQDGDLIYDGVIHREVPEIDDYATAAGFNGIGGSGGDIRPISLCGGGAVAVAWGQEPTPRTDRLKDYEFRPGVAIEELLGVKKISYNGVQNGMVTLFVAAAADS